MLIVKSYTPCYVSTEQHLTDCGVPPGFALLWTVFCIDFDARQKETPCSLGELIHLRIGAQLFQLKIIDLIAKDEPHLFQVHAARMELVEHPEQGDKGYE